MKGAVLVKGPEILPSINVYLICENVGNTTGGLHFEIRGNKRFAQCNCF